MNRPDYCGDHHLKYLDHLTVLHREKVNWPWSMWPSLAQVHFSTVPNGATKALKVLEYWMEVNDIAPLVDAGGAEEEPCRNQSSD